MWWKIIMNHKLTRILSYKHYMCVFCGRASLDIYFRSNKWFAGWLVFFFGLCRQTNRNPGGQKRIFLDEYIFVILKNVQPRILVSNQRGGFKKWAFNLWKKSYCHTYGHGNPNRSVNHTAQKTEGPWLLFITTL